MPACAPPAAPDWPWYPRPSANDERLDASNLRVDNDLVCRLFTPVLCSPWTQLCGTASDNRAIVYGLRPGASYAFRVFAGNLAGTDTSGISTQAVSVPPVDSITSAVTGLKVAWVTETQVCLIWNALSSSEPVVSYQVLALSPTDEPKGLQEVPHRFDATGSAAGATYTATFSHLIQDEPLLFQVRARSLNSSGYSRSPSSVVTAAPSAPPGGRIGGGRVLSVSESSVMLSWYYVGPDLVTRYNVQASTSNFTQHAPSAHALDANGNVYITKDEFVQYATSAERFPEYDYNADGKWAQNEFTQWANDFGGSGNFGTQDLDADGFVSYQEFASMMIASTGGMAAAVGGITAKFSHFDSDHDDVWVNAEYSSFALAFPSSVAKEVEVLAVRASGQGVETLNITGLLLGAQYVFRIRAANLHVSDFNLTEATYSDAYIPVAQPPPVADLQAVALGATMVTLSWTDPPGAPATAYQVRLSLANRGFAALCDDMTMPTVVSGAQMLLLQGQPAARTPEGHTEGGTRNAVTVTNLHRGARHRFRVHARNLNQNGYEVEGSNEVEIYLQMQPPPAYNVKLIATTATSVSVGWEAETFPRIQQFAIRWWTSGAVGVGPAQEMLVGEDERLANVSGLAPETQVAIAVLPQNWNRLSESGLEGAATIIVSSASVPGVVKSLTPIAVSSTSITLQFNESDFGSATRYVVQIKRSEQAVWRDYAQVQCRELSLQPIECPTIIDIGGLQQGISYDMVVLLLNQNADPPLRPTPLTVTPVNIPSQAVTNLRVTALTSSSVSIGFNIPDGIDAPFAFIVIWSCDQWSRETRSKEITETRYTVLGLTLNEECEVTVIGRNLNTLQYTGAKRAPPITIIASNVPTEPQEIEATSCTVQASSGYSSVTIAWLPPLVGKPIVEYKIEVANATQAGEVPVFYIAGYSPGSKPSFQVASRSSIPHLPFTLYEVSLFHCLYLPLLRLPDQRYS